MQIKCEKDVSVQINIWVTFHINNTQIVNESEREPTQREKIVFVCMALCCAVRCYAMLCCVWSGVEWHGVSNILYIYQIQIEMENIWGITATHHHQRPSSCFLFLCMCFFPASLTLRHFVIISFENMTYLYVYKHEFGKGRFLSWHVTYTFASAYSIDGMKFFGHIKYIDTKQN